MLRCAASSVTAPYKKSTPHSFGLARLACELVRARPGNDFVQFFVMSSCDAPVTSPDAIFDFRYYHYPRSSAGRGFFCVQAAALRSLVGLPQAQVLHFFANWQNFLSM
jgi:hypothetical protein